MKYEKLDSISHIHKRPDMYVGSIQKIQQDFEWISHDSFDHIIYKENFEYNPGLLRIFIEVLSNVIDNFWRSSEKNIVCKRIEISIEKET